MSPALLNMTHEALLLVVLVSAAPVLSSMVVGLLVGIGQAVTQVQDQALGLAARVIAVFLALAISGPWAFGHIARFARAAFLSAGAQ